MSEMRGPFKFSKEHPDDEFRLLSAYPTGNELLVIMEATMEDPTAIVHLFDDIPGQPSCEILHADEQTVLIQFVAPFIPPPFRAYFASGNLPRFPQTIQDGWIVCELTTSPERLSQFKDALEATGFTYEILSVTQSLDPIELLTDRQRLFMTEALNRGYYDSPRECSLTELATALDVSKSTASVVLHNAEETIIKEFFAKSAD
jgi:hypothetical protein